MRKGYICMRGEGNLGYQAVCDLVQQELSISSNSCFAMNIVWIHSCVQTGFKSWMLLGFLQWIPCFRSFCNITDTAWTLELHERFTNHDFDLICGNKSDVIAFLVMGNVHCPDAGKKRSKWRHYHRCVSQIWVLLLYFFQIFIYLNILLTSKKDSMMLFSSVQWYTSTKVLLFQ